MFCINNPSHYISINCGTLYLRYKYSLAFLSLTLVKVILLVLFSSLLRCSHCGWHFHSYSSVVGYSQMCVWGWCSSSSCPLIIAWCLMSVSCLQWRHVINERTLLLRRDYFYFTYLFILIKLNLIKEMLYYSAVQSGSMTSVY